MEALRQRAAFTEISGAPCSLYTFMVFTVDLGLTVTFIVDWSADYCQVYSIFKMSIHLWKMLITVSQSNIFFLSSNQQSSSWFNMINHKICNFWGALRRKCFVHFECLDVSSWQAKHCRLVGKLGYAQAKLCAVACGCGPPTRSIMWHNYAESCWQLSKITGGTAALFDREAYRSRSVWYSTMTVMITDSVQWSSVSAGFIFKRWVN